MISEQLQKKLDLWEKCYFSLDEAVPFKDNLKVYPVLVKDYYKFYSCFPCLTMDKNTKMVLNDEGKPIKVSNPKGIGMSYLGYLIESMQEGEIGAALTSQLIGLIELVFHEKNGFFCPNCGEVILFEEIKNELDNITKTIMESKGTKEQIDIAKIEYFKEKMKCKKCGSNMREIISIKNEGNIKKLSIKNTDISPKDFDELKALVSRQNILDYDGDKYVDPDLKEELEIKARLQNKNYTSPSLEKQMVCVCAGTGYTLKELKEIPLRKLTLLLKTVDSKANYYAQVQGAYSGMVKFKEDPKHWIFGDNKRDISQEFTSLDNFTQKFDRVT